ncbi:hypothetical protein HYU16_03860 [Candidatus Woesearchaeota archaeon]|nr:hypothetical protein [Candidatus Woesearchaeota archaeon]
MPDSEHKTEGSLYGKIVAKGTDGKWVAVTADGPVRLLTSSGDTRLQPGVVVEIPHVRDRNPENKFLPGLADTYRISIIATIGPGPAPRPGLIHRPGARQTPPAPYAAQRREVRYGVLNGYSIPNLAWSLWTEDGKCATLLGYRSELAGGGKDTDLEKGRLIEILRKRQGVVHNHVVRFRIAPNQFEPPPLTAGLEARIDELSRSFFGGEGHAGTVMLGTAGGIIVRSDYYKKPNALFTEELDVVSIVGDYLTGFRQGDRVVYGNPPGKSLSDVTCKSLS